MQPAPLHPANVEPSPAVAVNATTAPLAKLAEHVVGQLIPAGALDTVPVPVPASFTVKVKLFPLGAKLATTVVAAVIVNVHVPVPSHGPAPHPVNVDPAAAVGVNVICVPLAKLLEHVAPQLIPAGLLVTVPVPVPVLLTVKVKLLVPRAKLAVTVVAAVIVTTQVLVPVQPPPLQPVNVEPAAGVAVNVIAVPLAKLAEQVGWQLMPAGLLVTVPVPVPASATVSVGSTVPFLTWKR